MSARNLTNNAPPVTDVARGRRRPATVRTSPIKFDPFADEPQSTIHIPPAAPAEIKLYVPSRPVAPKPDISRLVAGILLNRIHAVGKPMRRRAPRGYYVRSCLSTCITVNA